MNNPVCISKKPWPSPPYRLIFTVCLFWSPFKLFLCLSSVAMYPFMFHAVMNQHRNSTRLQRKSTGTASKLTMKLRLFSPESKRGIHLAEIM